MLDSYLVRWRRVIYDTIRVARINDEIRAIIQKFPEYDIIYCSLDNTDLIILAT